MNAQSAAQPATPKQISFATKLIAERDETIVKGVAASWGLPYEMPDVASLTKGQVSSLIDGLMQTPKAKKSNAGAKQGFKLSAAPAPVQTTFEDPGNAAEAALFASEVAAEQAATAVTAAGPIAFSKAELTMILGWNSAAALEVDLTAAEQALAAKIAAVIA